MTLTPELRTKSNSESGEAGQDKQREGAIVDIRIGIVETAQPISVTLPGGADRAALKTSVEDALRGEAPVLLLADDNGREVMVVSSHITYVEIGPSGSHPIGFG